MSQEQQEKVQQQKAIAEAEMDEQDRKKESLENAEAPLESSVSTTPAEPTVPAKRGKRRRKKEVREILVNAADISPRPSIWPLALALSIVVVLVGIITNVIILSVGVILVFVSILGWGLERRKV